MVEKSGPELEFVPTLGVDGNPEKDGTGTSTKTSLTTSLAFSVCRVYKMCQQNQI